MLRGSAQSIACTLDGCLTLPILLKGWVQVIDGLFEAIRGDIVAPLVQQPNLNAPLAHRKTLHGRRFVTVIRLLAIRRHAYGRRQHVHGLLRSDELDGTLDLRMISMLRKGRTVPRRLTSGILAVADRYA